MSNVDATYSGNVKISREPLGAPLNNKQELLAAPIPSEYLESYTEDGIEFKGYKAQYAINLLNNVFGLGAWRAEFELIKVEHIGGAWVAYGQVEILVADALRETLLADGVGGSYAKRIENALKGAKTSAFKNACRYLGIGSELYLAGHDEDIIVEELPATADTNDETPNEIKAIIDKIKQASTLGELEANLPEISRAEGKAIKELLITHFNQKKIALTDK